LIKFEYNIKLIVVTVVTDRNRVDSNLQEIVIVVPLSNMGQKMLIVPFWADLVSFSHFGYNWTEWVLSGHICNDGFWAAF
jgi:hypothetical protein